MSIHAIATAAGSLATALFIVSTIPMLSKALRTRDLASYSGAHLVGCTVGNVAQAIYVATLEFGPIWILHGFNTAATALMLGWWLRYRIAGTTPGNQHARARPDGHRHRVPVARTSTFDWDAALAALVELSERPQPLPAVI